MKIKVPNNVRTEPGKKIMADYKPLVDLFALLLEWHIEDVKKQEQPRIQQH